MSSKSPSSLVLEELDALGFDAAIASHPGPDWIRLDRYAGDAAVLRTALELAGARYQLPEPSAMSGGWLVGDVAAAVAWPAVAVFLTTRQTLVTDSTELYLPDPATGRRLAIRAVEPQSCGPADPGTFADALACVLEPVVEAVHTRTRRGRHALWGTVTDMVAAAFHRVGDHLGRPDEARHVANAVIDHSASLIGGANWHDVSWSGGTRRTRIRNICCLWYRSPGGDDCLTCPRITDTERRQLLESRRIGPSSPGTVPGREGHGPLSGGTADRLVEIPDRTVEGGIHDRHEPRPIADRRCERRCRCCPDARR